MSFVTPFPEAESPALERFALHDRDDIAGVLGELRDRQLLVTIYYDDAAGFSVGNVLDVDAVVGTVVLDCAGDAAAQRSIAVARDVVVVAFLGSTKVQFALTGAELQEHEGRPAFGFRLPRRLLRIQRRIAPRRQPPGGRPAICRIPIPGSPDEHAPASVLDVSIGGIAVLATARLFDLSRDQVLAPCHLDLPELGQIGVTLKVRYLEAWPSEVGGRRCGCEFVALSEGARRSLQLYLDKLEGLNQAGGDAKAA